MEYKIHPQVKRIEYGQGYCTPADLHGAVCSAAAQPAWFAALAGNMQPTRAQTGQGFGYSVGVKAACKSPDHPQGYCIAVKENGITIDAADALGLRYAADTLAQLMEQSVDGRLLCAHIVDYPTVQHRGLMLDVSRGKVYTLTHLMELVELLARLRYNVLQLYVEHTFAFEKHPEIWESSDPLTATDIKTLQRHCQKHGIELQANLQSLGHFRRILTRPQHRHLAESDMFWSLNTTSPEALRLLDDLYSEYLPLFDSEWLNVCLDEPYDIGKGESAGKAEGEGELYAAYLVKVHDLAARYGKKIMVFGDVVCRHPELAKALPQDMLYLDWCYDPKPVYGNAEVYSKSKLPFWACPGSGNWNTLFPRVEGAVTNVVNLTLEGIANGTQGMLFTDWNDHGGYTQPAPGYYLYAYASAVCWQGQDPGQASASCFVDRALALPGYSAVVNQLAAIYCLPPIWSKNRSECVMALFDEPVFGNAVRGPSPPQDLRAYDLTLPKGVQPVFERHSQHPLRPYFSIPESTCHAIGQILQNILPQLLALQDSPAKRQLQYVVDAFTLMLDKLEFSRRAIQVMEGGSVSIGSLLDLEEGCRLLIRRFVFLQMQYVSLWLEIAKPSEIDISLTYFAHAIERLDYLRDWLSIQREKLTNGQEADTLFTSYITAGYGTLPTY